MTVAGLQQVAQLRPAPRGYVILLDRPHHWRDGLAGTIIAQWAQPQP